jgi:hypothetical protein
MQAMQAQNKKAISRFSKTIKSEQRVITSNLAEIVPYSVRQDNKGCVGKPNGGLWYGCGNSWIEWCLAEDFGLEWSYVHEIDVDLSKIKVIDNIADFDLFSEKFGLADEFYSRFVNQDFMPKFDRIDWKRLESLGFMGIEINPYLWKRRLSGGMWYYGWDCASGCIWNAEAVKFVKLIARFDKNRVVRVK